MSVALDVVRAAPFDDQALLAHADAHGHVLAVRTAQHDARAAVGAVRAQGAAGAARLARAQHGGHLHRGDLGQQAGDAVAVEVQVGHGQPPVGPKRSAWIARGWWPPSTSSSATPSTNGVGPQTKQRAWRPGERSASMAASTRRAQPVQPGGASRVYVCSMRRPALGPSAASSSRYRTSPAVRAETSTVTGASLPRAARWRSMAISGTRPLPPATSSSGPPSSADQLKGPPIGPRSSKTSPPRSSSTRYGETSPSSTSSTVSWTAPSSGAEAIE